MQVAFIPDHHEPPSGLFTELAEVCLVVMAIPKIKKDFSGDFAQVGGSNFIVCDVSGGSAGQQWETRRRLPPGHAMIGVDNSIKRHDPVDAWGIFSLNTLQRLREHIDEHTLQNPSSNIGACATVYRRLFALKVGAVSWMSGAPVRSGQC